MVSVYLLEQLGGVFLPCSQDGDDLIQLPREDVALLPKVDVEYFLINLFPVEPACFLLIQVVEESRYFVGSDCEVDLSDHGNECGLVDFVVLELADDGPKVGQRFGDVVLYFQQNLLDVLVDGDSGCFLSRVVVLDERMLEHLLPSHPFVLVNFQTPYNEVSCIFPDLRIVGETQRDGEDAVEVFLQTSAGPRSVPENHFIEHESQTPDVRLGGIWLIFEKLGGHVDRCSTNISQLLLAEDVCFAGESEVSYLVKLILHQHIRRLHISVDVAQTYYYFEAFHYLVEYLHALGFRYFSGCEFLPEVAVAQFQHDEGEAVSYSVSDHLDGVWRFDLRGDLYFSIEGGHESGVTVEFFHVHRLYGVELFVLKVLRLEHLPVTALTQKHPVFPVEVLAKWKLVFQQHILNSETYLINNPSMRQKGWITEPK